MSNQPNGNRFNSSRDNSFYGITNTEGNTTKDTFLKNGSNIIRKDYSNFSAPRGGSNDSFNPYVMDAKIKDLESKLITIEQANKILLERINENEKNFVTQMKQIEISNIEEKENRYKAEQFMNIISEQNNANSNDLNMRINMLQERIIKGDETTTQQRQLDLESQKYLLGKVTEKITKTVKSEVEARFKADIEGKIFSQRLSNKFESSLDTLKKEIEEITNQTRVEMQNISRECSERTHNVSKYIDQQIQEAVFGKGSSNEELKNFVRKLTEQVKSSLISISKKHEMIEERLNNLENKDDKNMKSYHDFMTLVEQRLMKKINDVKIYTELNMTRHDQFLEQSMKDSITKIEKNIQFLAGQLIDTREKINERFEKIFEDHHNQLKSICEDMDTICNQVYKYENLLKDYEIKYNDAVKKIDYSLANVYAREDVQIVQERIIKTIECNFLQEQINRIHNALQTCNVQFNENMSELNKGSQNSFQFLSDKLDDQKRQMELMGEKNLAMFEDMQKAADAIDIKQIVNEMVAKVDNILVLESIQKSKNTEHSIMLTIEEHKNNILNSINEINVNKEDICVLKDQVTAINHSLDQSGQNMSNMADYMKRMREESKELEMKESVKKVVDSMITNVEAILTKERMDRMSKFDLNQMRETIIDLEDKYNSLSNTNTEIETIKEDIKELSREQEILKNKPKGEDGAKLATIQMLNNVEFENIYSILNSGDFGSKGKIDENEYNQIVDNKINKAMEQIKSDNENMWIKCVMMKDKVNDPEEIRKILNDMHPTVLTKEESYTGLLGLSHLDVGKNTPLLNSVLQYNDDDYNYGNNSNGQQDPGPDINSKKSSKKSKAVSNQSKKNINNKQEENKVNNINEEKKSKGTNRSKNGVQSINEDKKSKGSNRSKNMSKNASSNEENRSKGTNKSKTGLQPIKEENASNKDKKSSNRVVAQKEENQNKNAQDKENEEEEDEGEEEEEDEEGEQGGQEVYAGEMKSKNEVSGKSKPK